MIAQSYDYKLDAPDDSEFCQCGQPIVRRRGKYVCYDGECQKGAVNA